MISGLYLEMNEHTTQINTDTTHWYHVINNGASNFKSGELNKYLLTNTIDMDTLLNIKIYLILFKYYLSKFNKLPV